MGVLRALVLLTFISWRVGKLMAAMAPGVSFLHSFKVSTPIKPSYYPVLLPCLLCGYESCMVPSPSQSSTRSGASTNSVNSANNLYVSGNHDPSIPVLDITERREGRRRPRRWRASHQRAPGRCGCLSWGLQRELSSSTPIG